MKLALIAIPVFLTLTLCLGFKHKKNNKLISIFNDTLEVTINTKGAELWSICDTQTNYEFLWQGNPKYWKRRSPVMFPICVRFKDHKYTYKNKEFQMPPLGLADRATFTPIPSKHHNEVTLEFSSNQETLKFYPFHFKFSVTYKLQDNTLVSEFKIQNTGNNTMLYALGGHPGIMTPFTNDKTRDSYEINVFKPTTVYRTELIKGLLSDKKTLYIDNESRYKLSDPRISRSGQVLTENVPRKFGIGLTGKKPFAIINLGDFPNTNIWTPPGRPYVCIEPLLGHHDTSNSPLAIEKKSHMSTLAPGKTDIREFTIELFPENIVEKIADTTSPTSIVSE